MVNYKKIFGITLAPLSLILAGLFNNFNTKNTPLEWGSKLTESPSLEKQKTIDNIPEENTDHNISKRFSYLEEKRLEKQEKEADILSESTPDNFIHNKGMNHTAQNNYLLRNSDTKTITYLGNKGQYTVDYNEGTYYGCVKKTGCLFLGREKKIGESVWKNGTYTYSIDNDKIKVLTGHKIIFEDVIQGQKNKKNYNKITFYGYEGQYTVDYEKGTYYGCVKKTGCLFLGKEKKIGESVWKNGTYTYSIDDNIIQVHNHGNLIFQDRF